MQIPQEAIELELLVQTLRAATSELLDMEMYDRYGRGSDPAMNRKMEQAASVRQAQATAKARLSGLVRRYRTENPAALGYWASAHIQLLEDFLGKVTDSTARYVATQEIAAWQALLAGNQDIVEENTYYVGPDAALHAKLFGKLEIPPLYPGI